MALWSSYNTRLKSIFMVFFTTFIGGVVSQSSTSSTSLQNETIWVITTRSGNLSDTSKSSTMYADISNNSRPTLAVIQSTQPSRDTSSSSGILLVPPNIRKSSVRNYPWVIALIVISSLGILTVVGLEITILFRIYGTPLWINWKSLWLGQILMFAIFCSYLTQFAFIPYSSTTTCYIIRFCVGVSYAMTFSVLIVKLLVILCNAAEQNPCFQVVLFLALWAIQLVIDIQWLISDSAHTTRDVSSRDGYVCDPGYKAHVQSLVYVMLLIVLSALLSLLTHRRRNPGSVVHLDGMLIGISAGLSVAVWIVWILLGFLNNDKNWHDPCIAFGLATTATVLLVFMIIPKVYHLKKVRKAFFNDLDSRADSKDTKKTIDILCTPSGNGAIVEPVKQTMTNEFVAGTQINGKAGLQNNGITAGQQINGVVANGDVKQRTDLDWTPDELGVGETRLFYQMDSVQYDSDPSADTRISHRTSGRYQQSGLRSHHPQWGTLNSVGYNTSRRAPSGNLQRSSSLHSYHHRSPGGQAPPPYWEAGWPGEEGEQRYRVAALYSARPDTNGRRRWNLSEPDLTVIGRSSSSSTSSPRMNRHRSMERASSIGHGRYHQSQPHRLDEQRAILSSVISITN